MTSRLRRPMAVALGIVAALALCFGPPAAAYAATLAAPSKGTYLTYRYGGQTLYVGAIGTSERGHVYCIEAGKASDPSYERTEPIPDGDDSRRIAWLAERYRDSRDPQVHAGIGVLAHQHFDRNPQMWSRHWSAIRQQHPDLEGVAERLWNEAGQGMPADVQASYAYGEGLRSGTIDVSVTNGSGEPVAGVQYRVTLDGPAEFDGGGRSVESVSTEQPVRHAWHATGAGDVTVSTAYSRATLQLLVSNQDYVQLGDSTEITGTGIRFAVRKDFTPTLTTQTSSTIVDPGDRIVDTVTSGVAGERDHWKPGLTLQATGWYFDGIPSDRLEDAMAPESGESAKDFLKRLEAAGYYPSAHGEATFDAPGLQVNVTALAEDGTPYAAPADGGFGTWVWAFERSRQSDEARAYLLHDVVSGFLEATETNANRAQPSVSSTVTEHSATEGAELDDTITITGFPDDHGSFAGDDVYGVGADNQYAQVRVWWAGDADDPTKDDDYRPDSAQEPEEDDHHRLIGTWDYPAANGTIRVGGGEPDAHGNPVHITAETHGWYIFVYEFAGDDRVMPVISAYDDAWERTRVERVDTPTPQIHVEQPAITPTPDRLPEAGAGVLTVAGITAAALAAGAFMLVMIRRRS